MDRASIERELNLIWAIMIVVTSIILFASYELTQKYICSENDEDLTKTDKKNLDNHLEDYGPLREDVCREWGWMSEWMVGISWVVTIGIVLMLGNRFYYREKEDEDKPDEEA